MIPIYEPYLKGNEKKYLDDCLKTNWISSQGKYIEKFEKLFSKYHDSLNAVATSNCTTALHLALKAYGIGKGDEVICPALTFISPANMVVLSGAELRLVDIDEKTLNINPAQIEDKITKKTKAIIVVHQFGHSADMKSIMDIAQKNNLIVIEDNAESLGGYFKSKKLGTIGDISTFSFFGNKIITTGEGGAILTTNNKIADKCRELRDHGMSKNKKYFHTDLGYNYRMTNMQAAIGLAQLEKLDFILRKRLDQMNLYYELLNNIKEIKLREFADWCTPVHWLMTVTLNSNFNRNKIIEKMRAFNIECRPMINPVHHALHFKNKFRLDDFPISNYVSENSIHLPSGTGLSNKDIVKVCDSLKKILKSG